jgi:hypothetical protein
MKVYILLLALLLSFTGCGSDDGGGSSPEETNYPEEINYSDETNYLDEDSENTSLSAEAYAEYSKRFGKWVEATDTSNKIIELDTTNAMEYNSTDYEDILKKDGKFYIRVGDNNVSFSGKFDGEHMRTTKNFEGIGDIEILLQNIQDGNIRKNATIDYSDGSFSGDGLPAGEYKVIGSLDGATNFETKMTLSTKEETLGNFKFVPNGEINLKAKVIKEKIDGKYIPFYAGQTKNIQIDVENIGGKTIEVNFLDVESDVIETTSLENRQIVKGETQTIYLKANFPSNQIENVKTYSFDLKIRNANDSTQVWTETISLKVHKTFSPLNFKVEDNYNFTYILRGEDGFIGSFFQNIGDFEVPFIDGSSEYKLIVVNSVNDNQGLNFGLSFTDKAITDFSSFETVQLQEDQVLNLNEEKKQKIFAGFAKVWSVKTAETNISAGQLNNNPPVAKLSHTSEGNESYVFDFSQTTDDSAIVKYTFKKGNTVLYSGLNTSFTISNSSLNSGENTFTLEVTDEFGAVGTSDPVTINVSGGTTNERPVAILTSDKDEYLQHETIELNASASTDDSGISSFKFSLEDGTILECNSEDEKLCNVPASSLTVGKNTIYLTVTDIEGKFETEKVYFKVKGNTSPSAKLLTDQVAYNIAYPYSLELNASASKDSDGEIISYRYFIDEVEQTTCNNQPFCTIESPFDDTKTYSIRLLVRDNDGAEANSTQRVAAIENFNVDEHEDLPPPLPDESVDEHGNTISTATTVSSESSTEGYISTNDSDYFKIEIETSGTLTVGTAGDLIDTVGYLYDFDGIEINFNDDYNDTNFQMTHYLSAGTYYVKVLGYSSNYTGDYIFNSSFVPDVLDLSEDHGSTIFDFYSVSIPSTIEASISNADDYDIFKIEVPTTQVVTIQTTGSLDTYGYLYDSQENKITENDDRGNDENFFISKELEAGTYFIWVEGYDSYVTGDYNLSISNLDYNLSIFGTATLISVPSLTEESIVNSDDYDLFKIEVPSTQTVTIQTTGNLDTVGYLFDSQENKIAENDDGENEEDDDENFLISQELEAGTYFIWVKGYDDSSTGSYTLSYTLNISSD